MDIKTFVKTCSKEQREAVAIRAGTTEAYLFQLAGGHRKPSVRLAKYLELASSGLMTRQELRPDIFS